jgi:PPOX class probable F420-dependent enzyme
MSTHPTTAVGTLEALRDAGRFVALRTRRRDGTPVDTPVWFEIDGARLWFRTKRDTAKVHRIGADPLVELRACDWRGRTRPGQVVEGIAAVLAGDEAAAANRRLAARYGWQWTTVPLVRIPGTGTVRMDLGWRDRWERVKATEVWPESCIVEVAVGVSGGGAPPSVRRG